MQTYCGEYKSEKMLKTGLWWLNSIRESEATRPYVRNPHELERYLECLTRLTVSEMIIHASLARKARLPDSAPDGGKRGDLCRDARQEQAARAGPRQETLPDCLRGDRRIPTQPVL